MHMEIRDRAQLADRKPYDVQTMEEEDSPDV